jgi:hypothetical protein
MGPILTHPDTQCYTRYSPFPDLVLPFFMLLILMGKNAVGPALLPFFSFDHVILHILTN